MAVKQDEVGKAFDRSLILREIVRLERLRAENAPRDSRNVRLGIVDADQPNAVAKQQITKVFNELELLLEHLHVSHIAARFETEALARLGNVIGETRNVIRKGRKSDDYWPVNLVRSQNNFQGLHDIEQVLSLPQDVQDQFGKIKRCRNDFGHGAQIEKSPDIAPNDARNLLSGILLILK